MPVVRRNEIYQKAFYPFELLQIVNLSLRLDLVKSLWVSSMEIWRSWKSDLTRIASLI